MILFHHECDRDVTGVNRMHQHKETRFGRQLEMAEGDCVVVRQNETKSGDER